MSTPAIVTMVLALVLVWGGFVASLAYAVVRSRATRAAQGRDDT